MIPAGTSRSTFHGHLPGGEIFGWSLWTNEAPIGVAATQAQATAFKDAFLAAESSGYAPHHMIGADAGYDGVTVYSYEDSSGHATSVAEAPMTVPGVNTGSILPNQLAVCVSLHTALAGRRYKGRVYLPLTEFSLSTGGELDSGYAGGLAGYMATLIHALNTAMSGGRAVSIVSQVSGAITPVSAVKVDTRIDIQRRRANRQAINAGITVPVV